ncbi:MAG: hypothetical protein L6Q81_11465 [Bacteroidia bacterium]|nr:hypothetical protein [Bacteroidia bacterium]
MSLKFILRLTIVAVIVNTQVAFSQQFISAGYTRTPEHFFSINDALNTVNDSFYNGQLNTDLLGRGFNAAYGIHVHDGGYFRLDLGFAHRKGYISKNQMAVQARSNTYQMRMAFGGALSAFTLYFNAGMGYQTSSLQMPEQFQLGNKKFKAAQFHGLFGLGAMLYFGNGSGIGLDYYIRPGRYNNEKSYWENDDGQRVPSDMLTYLRNPAGYNGSYSQYTWGWGQAEYKIFIGF